MGLHNSAFEADDTAATVIFKSRRAAAETPKKRDVPAPVTGFLDAFASRVATLRAPVRGAR